MHKTIALLAASALAITLTACPRGDDRMEVIPLESGAAAPAGGLPSGHVPVDGAQGAPGTVAPGTQAPNDAVHANIGGGAMPGLPAPPPAAIQFPQTPDGWASVKPSSSMRLKQFRLPDPQKAGKDGEVVVFFFGGAAGGVQANIDRWLNQWEVPGGKSPRDAARQDSGKAGEWAVQFVEVDGTYVAPSMPGTPGQKNQPGSTLLGAIVSTPTGNYFFKGAGPEKTMKHWRESFRTFVLGVRSR